MTKDQYLRMVEQTGEEIDWDRCPPDGDDFTSLEFILGTYYITDKAQIDWTYELILFLERRAIEDSRKQMKAEYDKIKKK